MYRRNSGIHDRRTGSAGGWMRSLLVAAVAVFLSALTGGGTFLLAFYRQRALVEVAACMALGVELHLLSSSVGDLIDKNKEPNK
jgi:hypothetical protein